MTTFIFFQATHALAIDGKDSDKAFKPITLIQSPHDLRLAGLHRVTDEKAGYHIYILMTGQTGTAPHIYAVPILNDEDSQ